MQECKHSWGLGEHPDGTIHQICLDCGEDAGPDSVKASGWGGSPYGVCSLPSTFVDVMPERPVFWDPLREVEWFRKYIARQAKSGGYISPEVFAAAAPVTAAG
jgi:hypothetical protein